jgi:hypothetical protein
MSWLLVLSAATFSQEYTDACESWLRETRIESRFSDMFENDTRCPYMDNVEYLKNTWAKPLGGYKRNIRISLASCDDGIGAKLCFPETVLIDPVVASRCSGVLVAPGVILTARHCTPVERVTFAVEVDTPAATYEILREILHPDRSVDAALLVLDGLPPISPVIWRTGGEPPPEQGTVLRAPGFGQSRSGVESTKRLVASISIDADGWGCPRSLARTYGCAPERDMVAFSAEKADGSDTCPGDSGGPVLEPLGGEDWRLIAITSRAVRGSWEVCGEGGVYLRVDTISGWMIDELRAISRIPR